MSPWGAPTYQWRPPTNLAYDDGLLSGTTSTLLTHTHADQTRRQTLTVQTVPPAQPYEAT